MKGIYKITNPNGHVYIGQSINIEKRKCGYGRIKKVKHQQVIERSILKHGFNAHIFEIVHELPSDIDKETLTMYEQFYIDQYKDCGVTMLNMCPSAGSPAGIKRPIEQCKKHSEFMKGRAHNKGNVHTDEAKEKIKEARAKQTNVKGPTGHTPWNKGLKYENEKLKGRIVTDEQRIKISNTLKGNKLSPESIAKRTETRRLNGWNKRSRL